MVSPSAPRPQLQIALGRATLPPVTTRMYPDPDQPGRGSGGEWTRAWTLSVWTAGELLHPWGPQVLTLGALCVIFAFVSSCRPRQEACFVATCGCSKACFPFAPVLLAPTECSPVASRPFRTLVSFPVF